MIHVFGFGRGRDPSRRIHSFTHDSDTKELTCRIGPLGENHMINLNKKIVIRFTCGYVQIKNTSFNKKCSIVREIKKDKFNVRIDLRHLPTPPSPSRPRPRIHTRAAQASDLAVSV